MIKTNIWLGLLAAAIAAGPANAQEQVPVSIIYRNVAASGMEVSLFQVQSLVKQINITDLKVNEGNCKFLKVGATGQPVLPMRLGYGETAQVITVPRCNALKVEITSDLGHWTLTFSN